MTLSSSGPPSGPHVAFDTPNARALLGFMDDPGMRQFFALSGISADLLDRSAFDRAVNAARAHVGAISTRPEAAETPLEHHPHLDALRGEPTFLEHAAGSTGFDFAMVDLDRLVVAQPRVDLAHVDALRARAPEPGDADGLLRFCLPLQAEQPLDNFEIMTPTQTTLDLMVDNPDVRVCGFFQGSEPRSGRVMVGFFLGTGLRQMRVAKVGQRHILVNGYHRAVALMMKGHRKIPVILAQSAGLAGVPQPPDFFTPQMLLGPTPARVEDFVTTAAVDVIRTPIRRLFSVHTAIHPIPG